MVSDHRDYIESHYEELLKSLMGWVKARHGHLGDSSVDEYDLAVNALLRAYLRVGLKLRESVGIFKDEVDARNAALREAVLSLSMKIANDDANVIRRRLATFERYRRSHARLKSLLLDDEYDLSRHDLLAAGLRLLDARERQVIVLHYFDDLGVQDIAEKLGQSKSTIYRVHDNAITKMLRWYCDSGAW